MRIGAEAKVCLRLPKPNQKSVFHQYHHQIGKPE